MKFDLVEIRPIGDKWCVNYWKDDTDRVSKKHNKPSAAGF